METQDPQTVIKAATDVFSLAVLLGWAADLLPSIATLVTIVWLGIQIWQSRVGQYHVECIRRRIAKIRGRRSTD